MTTFNFRGLPDCFVRMIRFFVLDKQHLDQDLTHCAHCGFVVWFCAIVIVLFGEHLDTLCKCFGFVQLLFVVHLDPLLTRWTGGHILNNSLVWTNTIALLCSVLEYSQIYWSLLKSNLSCLKFTFSCLNQHHCVALQYFDIYCIMLQ